MDWNALPGYPRLEAFVSAEGDVRVRDGTTMRLLRTRLTPTGAQYWDLKHSCGAIVPLTADMIRGLLGGTATRGVIAGEFHDEDEDPQEATEIDVSALKRRIKDARKAASNASLSQNELAKLLGVKRYWIRKALDS